MQKHNPETAVLDAVLQQTGASRDGHAGLLSLYQKSCDEFTRQIWQQQCPSDAELETLQSLYREYESQLAVNDIRRHDFVVVIPVADRPQQLIACLQSLLSLCQKYHYGGYTEAGFSRVRVIVADDSIDPQSIHSNQQTLINYCQQGLHTEYFGLQQQGRLLELAGVHQVDGLCSILGKAAREPVEGHKGASVTRNITYLRLQQLAHENPDTLFMFIDSDQEFKVRVRDRCGQSDVYAVNYFHIIDRLFRENRISVLTGKVVGDPPVSPAVMAGNFVDDVYAHLLRLSQADATQPCVFHQPGEAGEHDAAYHDMADMFGFEKKTAPIDYRCRLSGKHSIAESLPDFTSRLQNFFYGEHPTRVTFYEYADVQASLTPARTIYTGNYVLSAQALNYFIPFADLKLRMAGPVLGRLIQAEAGDRFVSANLPLLHKRTFSDSGQSEFRAGVLQDIADVDISGEFVRQFFGDVMLFSVIELTESGYPQQPDKTLPEKIVAKIFARLLQRYNQRQQQTMQSLQRLNDFYQSPGHWWHSVQAYTGDKNRLESFINNIQQNFTRSSAGYRLINDPVIAAQRCQQIVRSLSDYADDCGQWKLLLKRLDMPGRDSGSG